MPQGSVLDPLLSNIYINDMMNACGGFKCIQFTDDTTLYATGLLPQGLLLFNIYIN